MSDRSNSLFSESLVSRSFLQPDCKNCEFSVVTSHLSPISEEGQDCRLLFSTVQLAHVQWHDLRFSVFLRCSACQMLLSLSCLSDLHYTWSSSCWLLGADGLLQCYCFRGRRQHVCPYQKLLVDSDPPLQARCRWLGMAGGSSGTAGYLCWSVLSLIGIPSRVALAIRGGQGVW